MFSESLPSLKVLHWSNCEDSLILSINANALVFLAHDKIYSDLSLPEIYKKKKQSFIKKEVFMDL